MLIELIGWPGNDCLGNSTQLFDWEIKILIYDFLSSAHSCKRLKSVHGHPIHSSENDGKQPTDRNEKESVETLATVNVFFISFDFLKAKDVFLFFPLALLT